VPALLPWTVESALPAGVTTLLRIFIFSRLLFPRPNASVATDLAPLGWIETDVLDAGHASRLLPCQPSGRRFAPACFPPLTCARRVGPNMASRELQEFFAALRSGDPRTAESLLDRLEPSLRRIIRARLQDARVRRVADTSDIFQSLLKDFLFQRQGEHSPSQSAAGMYAYLAAAASHKIQAKLRKERRHAGSLADDFEPATTESPAGERLENRDLIEAIRERLAEDRRLLFDLTLRGLTWAEISAIVGGQPDTLRMRLRRGIASALSELGEQELSCV
jgi:DNA-directed RNA polymerase specialized sigma24 family protein